MAIVITQVGVISPFGRGIDPFEQGLANGVCVLSEHSPLQHMDSSLAGLVASNKTFRQYLKRRKAAKLMTPSARLAMDAVGQIWDAVGMRLNPVETGLFFSVGREPPDEGEAEDALIASSIEGTFSEESLAVHGRSLYPPLLPLKTLPNLILGHLSIHFGLCGENAAWAGEGVQSFIEGVWSILEGRSTRVLVGAADSLVDLGQARDLKRLGVSASPAQAAVAWLLEEESVATGPVLARIEWNGIDGKTSEDSFLQVSKPHTIRSKMGYCGVVEPQLQLLNRVLQGGVSHWHGLMVHSNR